MYISDRHMKGGHYMSVQKYYKHLSLDDGITIQVELSKGTSKRKIALLLLKDPSTICKEVKSHKILSRNLTASRQSGVPDCIHRDECNVKFCNHPCDKYEMIPCVRRYETGVCNGCPKINSSLFTKYKYDAKKTDQRYRETLVDSRQGVDLTTVKLMS